VYPGHDARILAPDEVVGQLVETLVDGVRGYNTAAENVDDDRLATLFRSHAQRRRELIEELARSARIDMIEADFDGTAGGGLHRAWISVEGAVAGDDAVVKSAIRGEKHALDECEDALGESLSEPTVRLVRRAAHTFTVLTYPVDGDGKREWPRVGSFESHRARAQPSSGGTVRLVSR
jgi:uncharacterized protein (TIGR02284 family)